MLPKDAVGATCTANPGGAVYNFVLDRCHVVMVNGVECVTWAHGLATEGVRHTFYGTGLVLEHLSSLPGYDAGLVHVAGVTRDAITGQTVGLSGMASDQTCDARGANPELNSTTASEQSTY
jgi:hypothetical protein